MRYFDSQNRRLIYLDQLATPDFWDKHWKINHPTRDQILNAKDTFVSKWTKKYLSPDDGTILEGGCGKAIHVAALVKNGFCCVGIDNASETIQTVKQSFPELDVRWGDVRHLDFADASLAGYWSLGVIEHFWDGYSRIGQEMARVIKPGGYLFLTFPYMSPLRKLYARLGMYPKWSSEYSTATFYQFALDHKLVIQDFKTWGFNPIETKPLLGLRGAEDDIRIIRKLYHHKGTSIPVKGLKAFLSSLLTPVTGHLILIIFKR